MNDMSIEADGAEAAPVRWTAGQDTAGAQPPGMEALSAADFFHLAEECFFLAVVAKDQQAAFCAPPFEKLLRIQGRAKLRSESWIVAGEFHSTRKFLRRSRGIRVFRLLLSNPLREKL